MIKQLYLYCREGKSGRQPIAALQVLPLPQASQSALQDTLTSIDIESHSHKPTAESLAALDIMTGSRKRKKPSKTAEHSDVPPLPDAETVDPQARLQMVQASSLSSQNSR